MFLMNYCLLARVVSLTVLPGEVELRSIPARTLSVSGNVEQSACFSTTRQRRNAQAAFQPVTSEVEDADIDIDKGLRRNAVGVQLLSPSLQRQLFPEEPTQRPSDTITQISLDHLRDNDLSPTGAAVLPEINFDLPPLQGKNIREHFHRLGEDVAEPYLGLAKQFAEVDLPPMPEAWCVDQPGWYRYDRETGKPEPVQDLSDEQLVCFDVEVLYKISPYPVMATAATPNAWYSWLSPAVFAAEDDARAGIPSTLIPLARSHPDQPKIIVGHNVGYDRSKVLEEYHVERTRNRWLDTLALHVSTKGITSVQRPAWQRRKREKREAKEHRSQSERIISEYEGAEHDEPESGAATKGTDAWDDAERWEDITSANALSEVARLHLGIKVDKAIRDEFGNADITSAAQLRPNLQNLLAYCAKDVDVTHRVLQKVLPLFLLSCPHPASFAGALTMGNPFLPIDKSWKEYIRNADKKYRELEGGVKGVLWELAYKLKQRGKVEGDPWSEQLDWEPKSARWADPFISEEVPDVAQRAPARQAEVVSEVSADDAAVSDRCITPAGSEDPEAKRMTESRALTNEERAAEETPKEEQVAESSSNPRWLAKGSTWLKGKPSTSKLGDILPYILRISYKGHPLVESREHRWIIAIPKDGTSTAADLGENLTFTHEDDHRLQALSDEYTFHRLATKAKVASPFTKARRADWVAGIFSSPYGELCMSLVAGDSRGDRVSDIKQAVETFLEGGRDSVQGRMLDWRDASAPVQAKVEPAASKPPPQKRTTGIHGTWPKWFWDLVPGGANALPPGELDLTVRKRVAPLLLRLQWKGFPLFYSREHGWLYRISKQHRSQDDDIDVVSFTKYAADADAKLTADQLGVYVKIPHHAGKDANVGNPLAKTFLRYIENGTLASAPAESGSADYGIASAASDAMNMNAQCSYWISARERIIDQMDIYAKDIGTMGFDEAAEKAKDVGIILPRVITMGTVTRRAVEATWLTASNAKKNRVGSELKAMVRAPSGYAIVGADVDSEELWIASVMGDSQFGMHGATAIGWMTLEGTKAAGTDLHSKTAKILKTSRDNAKVFNYSRIYGAGIKHAVQLLKQNNATLSEEEAMKLATNLYVATKGKKTAVNKWKRKEPGASEEALKSLWHGGSESYLFNTLESIAASPLPQTPALGCGVTDALKRVYLPRNGPFGTDYLPSRINWVVQSSGVDYLHLLIIGMEYLIKKYGIAARYMISVHDELRYLVEEKDKYRAALALQVANAWTRALLCYNLGMHELPQGVTFFSAVDIDRYLRKEVDMPCVTPSQPVPLERGESLDIEGLLKITHGDLGPVVDSLADNTRGGEVTLTQVAPPPDLNSSLHEAYLRVQAGKDEKAASNYIKQHNARQLNSLRRDIDDKESPSRQRYRTSVDYEDYDNIE
ncbi:DNA-directed DNA polymerase gamma mip1 [Naganishia albida]|nr:DNA-directed DNA polymerase gamma mip1 [Naganishia albida]